MPMPLTIHLELSELSTLESVKQHAASGLIGRGDPISEDATRSTKIIEIVRSLFLPLGEAVTIRLGDGTGSDRFLKADFAWGGDPDIGGVSAQGLGRTRMGPFNRRAVDQNKPVTGYIFEGAIGGWIVDLLGATAIRANNVFATFIAHELGHQLGLGHEKAKNDIMFVWADMPVADRQQYLRLANDVKLAFSDKQIATMKATIAAA